MPFSLKNGKLQCCSVTLDRVSDLCLCPIPHSPTLPSTSCHEISCSRCAAWARFLQLSWVRSLHVLPQKDECGLISLGFPHHTHS